MCSTVTFPCAKPHAHVTTITEESEKVSPHRSRVSYVNFNGLTWLGRATMLN